ncbi:MAG: ribulose-phosphate 3-epimerase [Alphaproteobacteria bacterium]|nr:ribulose-phosphate 3-epimerase [Alphaproteobacteria bacterium]
MNLFDSSFLCLDIGTNGVRGVAHRVRSGHIDNSAAYSIDNTDTVFALKAVVDELENKIGRHFDSAYITGNFGAPKFEMCVRDTAWNTEHKITAADVREQISQITPPDEYYPMHIIPLRYDISGARDLSSPVGHIDHKLKSIFGAIFYPRARLDEIQSILRRAHIQAEAFFAPHFLHNAVKRPAGQSMMFIDLGAAQTIASIWTDRGPVWQMSVPSGGNDINSQIAHELNTSVADADRIKRTVASMIPREMDRFTPADTAYDFSRADVNDIVIPCILDIIEKIKIQSTAAITKYKPTKIILTGGGAETEYMSEFFENAFSLPTDALRTDTSVQSLSEYIWGMESAHRDAYLARRARWQKLQKHISTMFQRRKPRRRMRFIPILPSTLCFDMRAQSTYSTFRAGGISMIHVDIMDGFYIDKMAGSISELKYIRAHTDAHLHVHLMTESPNVWAADAIDAGANTIIVSTNTSGVYAAVRKIRAAGRRAGIALNPESSPAILKPILHEVDEIMVMTVKPGAAGQEFDTACVKKIAILNAARKQLDLKFKISVDGGINDATAKLCWAAGADYLVSGSYLARSNDFPLAVQSLLPGPNN